MKISPNRTNKREQKKTRGQFYTTHADYILDGLTLSLPETARKIVEPFAGKGDLIEWVRKNGDGILPIEAYDIEPKHEEVIQRDTFAEPPDYTEAWVITNPPYLARNKSAEKHIYDKYDTNDLYKCFLMELAQQKGCVGGICIIPAGFFFSPRDLDVRCRNAWMSQYRILRVKYFEETVFEDTPTTIVSVQFERATQPLEEQWVEWEMMPSKTLRTFHMSAKYGWIIGGEIYHLPISGEPIHIRRTVEGQPLKPNEQQTHITLEAVDSGRADGRIRVYYMRDYVYPAKECSRSFATFRITGRTLSEEDQKRLCEEFNAFLEEKRAEYWSLFLPQFRESKEYARKRIPFELAYRIIVYLLTRPAGSA